VPTLKKRTDTNAQTCGFRYSEKAQGLFLTPFPQQQGRTTALRLKHPVFGYPPKRASSASPQRPAKFCAKP